jgi:hypothetical protein
MSVLLRRVVEGRCECDVQHGPGYEPECVHQWECEWGVIENAVADPREGLQPLMVTTREYVEALLREGPHETPFGSVNSANVRFDAARQEVCLVAHTDYEGQRTTWRLFDAHTGDEGYETRCNLLVGKWAD